MNSSVVAIIVPDPDIFVDWCQSKEVMGNYEKLCKNPRVNNLVLDDIIDLGKERGLFSFELVNVHQLSSKTMFI